VDPVLGKEALDALENINCVVDCRARIHEKIVLIDKEIVWHGSLNVLSHTHRTDESMTRIVNAGLAEAVAANMSKRHVSADKALQTIGDAENPRCEACGARTVYNEGRFGPYFYCEDECGWSINLKNISRQRQKYNDRRRSAKKSKSVEKCPTEGCDGDLVKRNGKFGVFYGCSNYPNCKYSRSI
jgi:hypothetical protein